MPTELLLFSTRASRVNGQPSFNSNPCVSMNEACKSIVAEKKCVNPKRHLIEEPQFLNECFDYDPLSGRLIWKERPLSHFKNHSGFNSFNARYKGKEVGNKQQRRGGKRHHIRLDLSRNGFYSQITAHKVIMLMRGIEIPDGHDIDHKNGDPWDNRWDNLRISSKGGSARNRGVFNRNGAPRKLPKGVNLVKGLFLARIRFNRELIYLGSFKTAKEASEAYEVKAMELFGEFYRKTA